MKRRFSHNSLLINCIAMLSSLLIFILLTYVVQSLKCPSCEFQLKIGDSVPKQSSLPNECEISEDNIGLCKLYLSIDYFTDNVYIWWSSIPNSIVEEQADLLDLPLPLNQSQKSLTKFQFDYKFKPEEAFYMGAVAYCHSNDLCIIDETENLLIQLYSLKQISSNIKQEIESYIIRSSSSSKSTIKCYHSFSDRVIDCGDVKDGACFIGIRPFTTELAAGCTGDYDHLFVSVSFYVTNPKSSGKSDDKGTCGMHCNRDKFNITCKMEQKMPLDRLSSNVLPRQHRLFDYEPNYPYVRHIVSTVAVASIVGLVILILMLAFPISMLVIGVRYRDFFYCPIEPRISRFLIVGGSVSIIWIILSIVVSLMTMFYAYTRSIITIICVVVLSLIILGLQIFSFIWLIVGSVWTFGIRNRVEHIINYPFNFPVYCQKTLYQFTFAYLILIYIFMALQCCGQCCMNIWRAKQRK
ncbi:hypothetical protein I4U23_027046 [Adineta vaga]|nr:hypothetical protein I4U23_027046 [Adineta vaga]